VRSGSNDEAARALEDELINLFDRKADISALDALIFALRPDKKEVTLGQTAIAFDANVFLRLSSHKEIDDIIDYLDATHLAPIILPGQVIQEFWNNQFQAVDSLASSIKKNFEKLKTDVVKIDGSFIEFSDRFSVILGDFHNDFGYVYDEATVRKTHALLDMIKKKATVPFARRSLFSGIAAQRKQTKTPPGFRDVGDGDFFVWVDLLTGLQQSKAIGRGFNRVALVTHDRKIDWSLEGTPHPILSAEIHALFGVPFEIWSIERLSKEVNSAT
jgi:hypothetical protein